VRQLIHSDVKERISVQKDLKLWIIDQITTKAHKSRVLLGLKSVHNITMAENKKNTRPEIDDFLFENENRWRNS